MEQKSAYQLEVLGVSDLDEHSLQMLRDNVHKVELVYQWIQQHIVEHMASGLLTIPPPILSRAFQQVGNGMVAFYDTVKITEVPFPFPYTQTCDFLLLLHWLITPVIVCQWTHKVWWAVIFSFAQVFVLWNVNITAIEIENPFGTDANDFDTAHLQQKLNSILCLITDEQTSRTPKMLDVQFGHRNAPPVCDVGCLLFAWRSLDKQEILTPPSPPSIQPPALLPNITGGTAGNVGGRQEPAATTVHLPGQFSCPPGGCHGRPLPQLHASTVENGSESLAEMEWHRGGLADKPPHVTVQANGSQEENRFGFEGILSVGAVSGSEAVVTCGLPASPHGGGVQAVPPEQTPEERRAIPPIEVLGMGGPTAYSDGTSIVARQLQTPDTGKVGDAVESFSVPGLRFAAVGSLRSNRKVRPLFNDDHLLTDLDDRIYQDRAQRQWSSN